MELENYDKFTSFADWQTVAIECDYHISVGMVNSIYVAYDNKDTESEPRGMYNMMTNTGWLEY